MQPTSQANHVLEAFANVPQLDCWGRVVDERCSSYDNYDTSTPSDLLHRIHVQTWLEFTNSNQLAGARERGFDAYLRDSIQRPRGTRESQSLTCTQSFGRISREVTAASQAGWSLVLPKISCASTSISAGQSLVCHPLAGRPKTAGSWL